MRHRRHRNGPTGPHRAVALCLPQVVAFDLAAPAEVFSSNAARRQGRPLYEFSVCAPGPGSVISTTGFEIGRCAGLEALERAETVVVPAYGTVLEPPPDPVLDGLRRAARARARP